MLGLEEDPVLFVVAANLEDELRLRAWLRRSAALAELSELARRLLDALDEVDEASAA